MCGKIFLLSADCVSYGKIVMNLMQDEPPAFPCVLKVGHAHGGLGKVKVEGETSWKDLARFSNL